MFIGRYHTHNENIWLPLKKLKLDHDVKLIKIYNEILWRIIKTTLSNFVKKILLTVHPVADGNETNINNFVFSVHTSHLEVDAQLELIIDCLIIKPQDNVKNLGGIFNRCLTWNDNIFTILQKVFGVIPFSSTATYHDS